MIKVYMPGFEEGRVGGGWTFARNFRRGMQHKVEFVNSWQQSDLVFIPSVTMIERDEVEEAHKAGKKIVFRADNVPRKSRNKRSRVYDNMRRYGEIADMVIYQSKWSEWYCGPMIGQGEVIYNGVDEKIFYPAKEKPDHPIYLFAFAGNNEVKNFSLAAYLFHTYHRANPAAEFWFIYDFRSETQLMADANYDFWNNEKIMHLAPVQSQEAMADLLRQCTHLIYPAYADAAPNMVLEARACGLEVVGTLDPAWSGVAEMLDPKLVISNERMCAEYFGMFSLLLDDKEVDLNAQT